MVGSVAYVGTQTTNQLADLDINAAAPGGGPASRPYFAQFGRNTSTLLWDGYLSANYHSLQTAINKQFTRGLLLKGAYTWSKAINMADDEGWQGVNWNHPSVFYRNRAPAGFDRRHIFQMGWVYELPMGRGHRWVNSGPAAHIIGGWQINGVFSAFTGTPFTVTAPGGALNAPGNTQTADQVKPVVTKIGDVGPGTRYYDITAFAAPTEPGRFGTAGRNILRNPGVVGADLSFFKNFNFRERYNLQFRSEWFNFTNTPRFGGMQSGDVTSGNFLRVFSASGERQIRFGLKFRF
jgi:hypothetical protein